MKTYIKRLVEKLREENPDMPKKEVIKCVMQKIRLKKAMDGENLEYWEHYVDEVVYNHYVDINVCC